MNQEFIHKMNQLMNSKTSFIISTIIKFSGSTPRKVGAKIITYISHDRTEISGTIGGGKLEKEVMEDATDILKKQKASFTKEYFCDKSNDMACGGEVEIFHEVFTKRIDLFIFGAGHVAQSLANTLTGGPFTMHLIDERSEWALSEKVPDTVIRHNTLWSDFIPSAKWDEDSTYAIVMTHDHKHDTAILQHILTKDSKYIGLMGSKNKWCGSQEKLINSGISQQQLGKVTCPIGDKSLGKGPTEIAIGIARQLLLVYQGDC